ncbi:MAG: PIG-L deacetylase family protein [Ignavibacteriaceae bacterium]
MKILVIAAHPDDEVYGMGGTIAKLSNDGNEVHVLIVTDGSTIQYKNHSQLDQIITNKKNEIEKANRILGTKEIHFGNLPDMRLDSIDHIEINKVIEEAVNDINPQVVYTHFYGDVNLDHQRVYEATLVACRPIPNQVVKEIFCYRVPSSTEWAPQNETSFFRANVINCIENFEKQKSEAIEAYKTEIREYPHPRSVRAVKALDLALGLKYGIGPAEEFILLRKINS